MCLPARSSICFGHVTLGNKVEISAAYVAKGAISWTIGAMISSPIRLSPTAEEGIGTGWLFWIQRTVSSPTAGAGRPAYLSAGQAFASCVQDNVVSLSTPVDLSSANVSSAYLTTSW